MSDTAAIENLYKELLDKWNKKNAKEFSNLFNEYGNLVGFDGSRINGRLDIETHLIKIFEDHPTGRYVSKIKEVRFITDEVVLLRGVSGVIPDGQKSLNPDLNAVQIMIASNISGSWLVELFSNTPAAFHGRPELSKALTEELEQLI